MSRVQAVYNEAILPEHKGNPLIEGLPPKVTATKLLDAFSYYPDLDEHIRQHPDPLVREEFTSRIKNLRQPFLDYVKCFRAIERAIKDGYSSKNPFSPTTAQYLHYLVDEKPDIAPCTGFFQPKADTITLVGESGVGKTSMLEQVLSYFPSVIEHDIYNSQQMDLKEQVVWIKVDCPNNSSVRDLCEEVLESLDLATGREKTKPAGTIGALMRQIEQRIKSSFLGILVIDEMQRLEFKRTRGENNLLNFLHSLVNKLGVPLFFCANPPFNDTLSKTLKAARRAESGGFWTMEPLGKDSDDWEAFIGELWELQWTNVYNELSDELKDKMYELSLGNLDIAHRIYREAQRLVIGSGDERINSTVLDLAYEVACGLSSKTEEIRIRREELTLPRRSKVQSRDQEHADKKTSKPSIYGDITRPQHPEFEVKIREILGAIDLSGRISNPDLFQQASDFEDPLNNLRNTDIVYDDPLSFLD